MRQSTNRGYENSGRDIRRENYGNERNNDRRSDREQSDYGQQHSYRDTKWNDGPENYSGGNSPQSNNRQRYGVRSNADYNTNYDNDRAVRGDYMHSTDGESHNYRSQHERQNQRNDEYNSRGNYGDNQYNRENRGMSGQYGGQYNNDRRNQNQEGYETPSRFGREHTGRGNDSPYERDYNEDFGRSFDNRYENDYSNQGNRGYDSRNDRNYSSQQDREYSSRSGRGYDSQYNRGNQGSYYPERSNYNNNNSNYGGGNGNSNREYDRPDMWRTRRQAFGSAQQQHQNDGRQRDWNQSNTDWNNSNRDWDNE